VVDIYVLFPEEPLANVHSRAIKIPLSYIYKYGGF